MLHAMALPTFAYQSDPVATGSIVQSPEVCERCEEARGFVYTGPIYAVEEVEFVCPWCIADGSASSAFDAEFTTAEDVPGDVPAEVLEEVFRRTPGFAGWQQERWQFHCADGAQFRGAVGYEDVLTLPGATQMLIADGWPEDSLPRMRKDGDFTGYLFTCRHCGAPLVYADCS